MKLQDLDSDEQADLSLIQALGTSAETLPQAPQDLSTRLRQRLQDARHTTAKTRPVGRTALVPWLAIPAAAAVLVAMIFSQIKSYNASDPIGDWQALAQVGQQVEDLTVSCQPLTFSSQLVT